MCSPLKFLMVLVVALSPLAGLRAQDEAQIIDSMFIRREVMIPMRDGVHLFTVILTPRDAKSPLPIILSRTPYGTANWGGTSGILDGFKDLIADGYVFVFQDVRGQFKSEGTFLNLRPPRNKSVSGSIDESTDAYDTIDWLIRNVPGITGRVGMLGISYPGWLTAVAGIDPHPALRAISPQAPVGDTWMGDDSFHQGAFRMSYSLEWIWSAEASHDGSSQPAPSRFDTFDWYLGFPTLHALTKSVGADQWPTWRLFMDHPSYDSVWQARSVPRYMLHAVIPTLLVGGWWDQEDMYGPLVLYATWEHSDTASFNYLVMGPWRHGQWYEDEARELGNLRFGRPTAKDFRALEARWFAHWLKDTPSSRFAEATVFDAGINEWREFEQWPPSGARMRKLYLRENSQASFEAPTTSAGEDHFVSDPQHPVPYRPRPIEWTYDPRGSRWFNWLTEDQRFVQNRPDVLSWETVPLARDLTVAGNIVARLFASTTGADADWVVKLIDVYPDSVLERASMGGYQLMVASDVMRGRYRRSFERPEPVSPDSVQLYTVDLHQQSYTFRKGHRIMVQVQSTWFPLYDRNPQTWVRNIFEAQSADFRTQTHRVFRTITHASHLELSILPQR